MKKYGSLLLSLLCSIAHAGNIHVNSADVFAKNANLIIVNDVSEFFDNNYGPASRDLSQALLEGESPILSTKALLQNILVFKNFYEDLIDYDLEYNVNKYSKIFEEVSSEKKAEDIKENIDIFKSNIMTTNQYLIDIKEYVKTSNEPLSNAIQSAINKYKSFLNLSSASWQSLKSKNLIYLFHSLVIAFFVYKSINFDQYYCKDVNENFILFIPKKLEASAFNFQGLNEYPIDLGISVEKIDDYKMSEQLLEALKKICSSDKKYDWNIIFSGHGLPQDMIAGMPTVSESNTDSLFMKCLNFFRDKVNTQNVVIISCYPGGQKIKSTFSIDSEFDNAQLARLNYTLIFAGSQPTAISIGNLQEFIPRYSSFTSNNILKTVIKGTRDICFIDLAPFWSTIFKALDDKKYETVGNAFGKFLDNRLELNKAMLIKLPHQEWMQPIAFTNDVKKLSQIEAINASKPIVYSDKIRFLLLSANYIPATVRFSGSDLPLVLPTTHLNYNFYFEKILTPLGSSYFDSGEIESKGDSENFEIKKSPLSKSSKIDSYLNFVKKTLGHFLGGDLKEPIYFYINKVDNHNDCSVLIRVHSTLEVKLIYGEEIIQSFEINSRGTITPGKTISKEFDRSNLKKELQRVVEVIERATNQSLVLLEGVQKIDNALKKRNSNPVLQNPEFDPIFTTPELVPVDSGLLNSLAKQDTTLIKGSVVEIENASGEHSLENESVEEDSNLEVGGAFVAADYKLIPLDATLDELPEEKQGCVKNVLLKFKRYLSSWI